MKRVRVVNLRRPNDPLVSQQLIYEDVPAPDEGEALRSQLTEELVWQVHRCGDDCYEPPTDAERARADDITEAIWPLIAAKITQHRAKRDLER